MTLKGERLKDEGSRLQVTAAGATSGLISRYALPSPESGALSYQK